MNVTLVYPAMEFGVKRGFGFPPLGILYIATYLRKKGINSSVIDAFINGYTLKELVQKILSQKPDIVGFSAMTCQVQIVMQITKALKEENPSLKIVVGGSHIASTKAELLSYSQDIDFLLYGESEECFYNLVKALETKISYEHIPGIIFRKQGSIVVNEQPLPVQSLDDLPFPDFSMVDLSKYDSYYAKSLPLATLMASRGCPFNCTFCDAYATHGKKLRLRSPKNIVDEIEQNLEQFGINQIMIKDSTFTVNKQWVYEICSELHKRDLKINWTCNTRVDMVDIDLLKAMKKAGCHMVMFGIESGSQKVLDAMNKGITIEQIKDGIQMCKEVAIDSTGYFMVGNPEETKEDALKSIALAKSLPLDMATFGVTIAYPGTELYDWAVQNNVLINKQWYLQKKETSRSIREVNGNLNLPGFSPESQSEIVKKANKDFYMNPKLILRNISKIRTFQDIKRRFKAALELLQD